MTSDPAIADDIVSEAFLRLALELRAGLPPRGMSPGQLPPRCFNSSSRASEMPKWWAISW